VSGSACALRSARVPASARALRSARGQATVELVGLLPLLLAVALAVFAVLAAGAAKEAARAAAQAGAVAMLQDRDPKAAARAAVPDWARGRVDVAVRGRSVRVVVRPRTPVAVLDRRLVGRAEAHAGPATSSGNLP
jgi:hypothetical protein